jgi:hypothetical protein
MFNISGVFDVVFGAWLNGIGEGILQFLLGLFGLGS